MLVSIGCVILILIAVIDIVQCNIVATVAVAVVLDLILLMLVPLLMGIMHGVCTSGQF